MTGSAEKAVGMAGKLGLVMKPEEKEQKERLLMVTIMKKWLPAGDAMLDMIVKHLPSPVEAQRYRAEILYEGPMDDEAAIGNTLISKI